MSCAICGDDSEHIPLSLGCAKRLAGRVAKLEARSNGDVLASLANAIPSRPVCKQWCCKQDDKLPGVRVTGCTDECESAGRPLSPAREGSKDSATWSCTFPELMDATDGACPAWWRAEEHVSKIWEKRLADAEKLLDDAREFVVYARRVSPSAAHKNDAAAWLTSHDQRKAGKREEPCAECGFVPPHSMACSRSDASSLVEAPMTPADALRRLLADVRAARRDEGPVPEYTSYETLDYIERLALDGLAGEARLPPCGLTWFCSDECALAGKHVKPTNEARP